MMYKSSLISITLVCPLADNNGINVNNNIKKRVLKSKIAIGVGFAQRIGQHVVGGFQLFHLCYFLFCQPVAQVLGVKHGNGHDQHSGDGQVNLPSRFSFVNIH